MDGSRLAHWETRMVDSYAMRPADLAVFRILYASYVLVSVVPVAAWLPRAPQAFFNPPIGPAALFTSPPRAEVLIGLNALLAWFAAMLLVGWRTRLASIGSGLTLMVLDAWAYSLGHISHDILLVIAPLVLAFSTWGRAWSVDGAGESPNTRNNTAAGPMCLLAMLVAFAMLTAGWAKATHGWLDPRLKCTFGHLVYHYMFIGRETWGARWAFHLQSGVWWKSLDWATVALELGFFPAVLSRRAFSLMLAIAAIFHLGVLLLFNISFASNVIVYGAFVRYAQVVGIRTLSFDARGCRGKAAVIFTAALAVGLVGALGKHSVATILTLPADDLIVWAGAITGVVFLAQRSFVPFYRNRLCSPGFPA